MINYVGDCIIIVNALKKGIKCIYIRSPLIPYVIVFKAYGN